MKATIKFTTSDELNLWLKDKSLDWIQVITTRTALRVLPLVFSAAPETTRRADLLLQACRAAFVAWTYAGKLSIADENKKIAFLAHVAATTTISRYAQEAAYDAACAAASASARAAAAISGEIQNAAATAGDADDTAFAMETHSAPIWRAVSADATSLIDGQSAAALMARPLWQDDVRGNPNFVANFPPWLRDPFDTFDKSSWVTNGPWGVWLAWYREILPNHRGRPRPVIFTKDVAFAIASREEAFWRSDPHQVTAGVAAVAGWKWNEANRVLPEDQEEEEEEESVEQSSVDEISHVRQRLLALIFARIEQLRPSESVEPQSDEPTADDQLGRRPFAQALVERMDKLQKNGGHDGFAAHIHAPWGAGKTSVLMMMRDLMVATDRKTVDGKVAPPWVVVHFNAWEQERRNPPWWPLMEAVKTECVKSLSDTKVSWLRVCKACWRGLWRDLTEDEDKAALLEARWIGWRIKTDALPYLLAIAVAVLCFWLLWSVKSAPDGKTSTTELLLKVVTAAVTAYAAFFGASRFAVFGSNAAAKLYEDISQDPLKRIIGLFKSIVRKTNKPLCVFIDDLDRCRADYVVDLLEGIQTSFRHKNVVYVVAADRSWIKASFEARYSGFSSAVGTVGQPLGYLFLEKIFQVSTPVPGMGDKTRSAYWNRLLKGGSISEPYSEQAPGTISAAAPPASPATKEQFDRAVESKREDLRKVHESLTREQAEVALQTNDTAVDRAAIVLELNASRAAEKEAEHLLAQFTSIVPDNPRVMKRMVNAFAMRQAIGLLERNRIPTGVLARWTILEQRYPALADLLIEHPEQTDVLAGELSKKDRDKLPPSLIPFAESPIIQSIIGKGAADPLTGEHVQAITRGSVV